MKPTGSVIAAIIPALALLGHVMDRHELDRLGEIFALDAFYDCGSFGLSKTTEIGDWRGLRGVVEQT